MRRNMMLKISVADRKSWQPSSVNEVVRVVQLHANGSTLPSSPDVCKRNRAIVLMTADISIQ